MTTLEDAHVYQEPFPKQPLDRKPLNLGRDCSPQRDALRQHIFEMAHTLPPTG